MLGVTLPLYPFSHNATATDRGMTDPASGPTAPEQVERRPARRNRVHDSAIDVATVINGVPRLPQANTNPCVRAAIAAWLSVVCGATAVRSQR
jgi:hypothetical protein